MRAAGRAPTDVRPNAGYPKRLFYADSPLSFEVNHGQSDPQVKFLARGFHQIVFLTATEAVIVLTKREGRARESLVRAGWRPRSATTGTVLRMVFVEADANPQVAGETELPGKANYFIGNVPAKWHTNVPMYARVRYPNLYRGIDLVYHGHQDALEYDFVVRPGADPRRITLRYEGTGAVEVDVRGDLVFRAAGGLIRCQKPAIYQVVDGARRAISGGYELKHGHEIGFHVGAYDVARPLVIDPVLSYSTYLGGTGEDAGYAIAVDAAGSAYITGQTGSTDFPTRYPLPQISPHPGDAFVTKLNTTGSQLVYSTYLGGGTSFNNLNASNAGQGIAVDAAGNAYVTGWTDAVDFPTTGNAFQPQIGGPYAINGFVTKLNRTGSQILYSTYLGGGGGLGHAIADMGAGIAVDPGGNVYVAGLASSQNFPVVRPLQPVLRGYGNAFVVKFAARSLTAVRSVPPVYSTYLGGSSGDAAAGIAADAAGNAYVTGSTASPDFPVYQPLQSGLRGYSNAFVTKLNPVGSGFVYSTYLGGSNIDGGSGIAADAAGNAYVTGGTASANFPRTPGAFQPFLRGYHNAFVTALNATGSGFLYSTYLGGSNVEGDSGAGIAVDAAGNAYVTGNTSSSDFPTVTPVQAALGGPPGLTNAFVAMFNPGGVPVYSTYLGGNNSDVGTGIAVDALGSAYVTGVTSSTNFPTANAFQPVNRSTGLGASNAFVAKIARRLVYVFQGTATGRVGLTLFRNQFFMLTLTADPTTIGQQTLACAVPSGTCTVFAVPGASATILITGVGQATITSPVGVFVNQTFQTLGFTRMPIAAIANADLMDLQFDPAFGTYNLASALGPIGPFFPTTVALGQFNCSFGCVMTSLGTLTVDTALQVTFAAQ